MLVRATQSCRAVRGTGHFRKELMMALSLFKSPPLRPRGMAALSVQTCPARCPPTPYPQLVRQGAATALQISAHLPANLGEPFDSPQPAESTASHWAVWET
jgi:hypothetical protein